MTLFHLYFDGAVIVFITIVSKFWWDLRNELMKYDQSFRNNIRSCREEYWSRFVYNPLNSFFDTAYNLILLHNETYETLNDVFMDTRHGSQLESNLEEMTNEYDVYIRLGQLTKNLGTNTKKRGKNISYLILVLILLFILISVDYINLAFLSTIGITLGELTISYIISACLYIMMLIDIVVVVFVTNKVRYHFKEHQMLQDFFYSCQERLENE